MYKKRKESSNSTKEVVLQGNNSRLNNSLMVGLGNVGRVSNIENIDILLVHDLDNWVMDSGATCHMKPYQ